MMESSSPRTAQPRPETVDVPSDSSADPRSRLAQRIQFPEGAAWAGNTPMAIAFRDALCDVLREEDIDRIQVRCGVARDEHDGLRFMCKVEYSSDAAAEGFAAYPWSWWSPLMEKPEELVSELRRALRQHRERSNTSQGRELRAPRAHKSRGPSHDTWTTAPWDLGRSVRSDNFCRNRRGRWTGHAAGAKPFRPRSPR